MRLRCGTTAPCLIDSSMVTFKPGAPDGKKLSHGHARERLWFDVFFASVWETCVVGRLQGKIVSYGHESMLYLGERGGGGGALALACACFPLLAIEKRLQVKRIYFVLNLSPSTLRARLSN